MKIIIKERELEYVPDYPEGWKFTAGDPYKFPVMIGSYKCFVKRFEKKDPKNITGWPLLNDLKGRYENNLPRVYDIKEADDKGRTVHYVFYEHIDGKTLETAINTGTKLDLERLTNDLFTSVQSIGKHNFWFVDFCEKNIFLEQGGRFLLVDLDSAEKVQTSPDNGMYGCKDYWIPVYRFYKEVLGLHDVKLADLNGISLNYLQIPFLVLRLKIFQEQKETDYNSDDTFDQLPALLDKCDLAFRKIFSELLHTDAIAIPTQSISHLREMVLTKILYRSGMQDSSNAPTIKSFDSDSNEKEKGEIIKLSWKVEGADKIELHRNGVLHSTIPQNEENIEVKEFYDNDKDVSYHLVAYQNTTQTISKQLIISHKKPPTMNDRKKRTMGIVAGAVVIAIALFLIFNPFKKASAPPSSRIPVKNIILLGHVDHGKSTLAAAISRQLADQNLMTQVSYRSLSNPGQINIQGVTVAGTQFSWERNGQRYNLIDCHALSDYQRILGSDTVKLDGAILVVAGTDGPMPHTREQLELANLHGVREMIVFINKIDLVEDTELLQLVEQEIRELISRYGFSVSRTPILMGSALMALRGDSDARGQIVVDKLLNSMDTVFRR